jgi:hypothetical protein
VRRRAVGVQTPIGEPLQLPMDWSVRRLVELAMSKPTESPMELALSISRQQDFPLPMVQFDNVVMVLEAQAETVRAMFAEVDAFQRGFRTQRDVGLPVNGVQRAFEIWINQQRRRARGYYGSVLNPTPASSTATSTAATATTTTTTETAATTQTARRGRRSARPTTSSTRVDRSAGTSRSSSSPQGDPVVYMSCSDSESRDIRMIDTEPEDWGSDDPYF